MNFHKLSSIPIFREAVLISEEYSLLSSDAYIASFAKGYGIINIATNDPEENWKRLDTRRTRWAVNKAIRSGVPRWLSRHSARFVIERSLVQIQPGAWLT